MFIRANWWFLDVVTVLHMCANAPGHDHSSTRVYKQQLLNRNLWKPVKQMLPCVCVCMLTHTHTR